MKKKRIYLIGMPASGKSTIGEKLATFLGWQFTDIDTIIEQTEKKAISNIFKEQGEEYFREVESKILKSTMPEKAVIATGGGAPCFFDHADFMHENGLVVFIGAPAELLAERAMAKQGTRPLLAQESLSAMIEALENKWKVRRRFYERAAHLRWESPVHESRFGETLRFITLA